LESSELREAKNRGQGLIVSGCLPQRFRDDLPRLLPEVDAFMGIDQVAKVSEIVHGALAKRREKLQKKFQIPNRRLDLPTATQPAWQSPQTASPITHQASRTAATQPSPILEVTPRPTYIPDYSTPRFRLTPRHFAYVKIAEGCNHPCSFCIIPRMRGAHRSRTQGDIVQEARQLVAEGVRELNLISQDSTYYGLDLRDN